MKKTRRTPSPSRRSSCGSATPSSDYPQELVLERWIRWEQVYGPSEEDLLAEEQAGQAGAGMGGGAGG